MTDRKYYLWLIPGVLVFGLALALVLTFQPVMAGSSQAELNARNEAGLQSVTVPQGVAVPQVEIEPACTLETTESLAISHWLLEESAPPYTDTVGSHNGTCTEDSCPSRTFGTNAYGQFFIDTDEDAITVPTNAAFDFLAAEPFSAGIWVKTTQSCTENKVYIGRYGTAGAEGRWWLGCVQGSTPGEGVARFHMRDSSGEPASAVGSTKINDGKWHYLTGVWDGADTKLYVDGGLEDTVSSPPFAGNFTSTKPITIGAFDLSGGGYYSTGALDEAAVFDSALSELVIDTYIATCNFTHTVGDVTFDTSKNVPLSITAAELLANTSGSGLSVTGMSSTDKSGAISGIGPLGPFLYTPATDYVGTDFFRFQVTNGGGDSAWGNAVITQEAPQVSIPVAQTNYEGAAVSLPIVAVDPQGDVMTYAAAGLPTGLTIAADTGLISGKVAAGASVLSPYDPVTVTVTDDEAHATAVEFLWTIDPNEIPVLTPIGPQSNEVGDVVSLQVVASDADVTDTLTYGAVNLPTGLSISPTSGSISGTVSPSAASASVTVSVTDGKAAPVLAIFNWTITGANMPPVVVKPPDQANFEGDVVSLQVLANDPDSDPLTYSATGLPAGLGINSTTGLISGKITAGASAFSPYKVKVKATDPGLLSDEREFSWTVRETPEFVFLPLVIK